MIFFCIPYFSKKQVFHWHCILGFAFVLRLVLMFFSIFFESTVVLKQGCKCMPTASLSKTTRTTKSLVVSATLRVPLVGKAIYFKRFPKLIAKNFWAICWYSCHGKVASKLLKNTKDLSLTISKRQYSIVPSFNCCTLHTISDCTKSDFIIEWGPILIFFTTLGPQFPLPYLADFS